MKTHLVRGLSLRLAAATLVLAAVASSGFGQLIDPDPEIFDGTRTKSKSQKTEDKETTIDDWEKGNIIVYDQEGEASPEGGQGRLGGKQPGMEIGTPEGTGMGMPLPMGGSGGEGTPSAGTIPQGTAASAGSTPGTQGTPPPGEIPGGKPGEVGIGDPNGKIKTTTVSSGPAGTEPPGGPQDGSKEDKDNQDGTEVPKAASGQQSGPRRGGVEKGDAMPTDI
jgi:hypothetical protein